MPKRGFLLFDLDGTLVDSASGIATALSTISRRRGGHPVSARDVRPLVSLGAATLVARALGRCASDPAADLAEFRAVLGGLRADRADCYAGVESALDAFAAAGYGMAVVTNKPEGLSRALLAELDLARYFRIVVGGDTTSRPKPDPAPALHALRSLGCDSADAIFIGDSDVDAATAACIDIPFVLFEGGYGSASGGFERVALRFSHFAELPAAIASLDRPESG